MNMTIEEYERYEVYKRRDKFLGNPFICEAESDATKIDKFLKIAENYINMNNALNYKTTAI